MDSASEVYLYLGATGGGRARGCALAPGQRRASAGVRIYGIPSENNVRKAPLPKAPRPRMRSEYCGMGGLLAFSSYCILWHVREHHPRLSPLCQAASTHPRPRMTKSTPPPDRPVRVRRACGTFDRHHRIIAKTGSRTGGRGAGWSAAGDAAWVGAGVGVVEGGGRQSSPDSVRQQQSEDSWKTCGKGARGRDQGQRRRARAGVGPAVLPRVEGEGGREAGARLVHPAATTARRKRNPYRPAPK